MSTSTCPCGSGKTFSNCCEPVLQDHGKAKTAEQLMRSRYSAYCVRNSAYLLKSWLEETRPEDLNLAEDPIQWVKLTIEESEKGEENDNEGTVTFTASFLSSGHLCHLNEKSSFTRVDGNWYYVDGKTRSSTAKMGRNDPCPCGSGKKYKKCCSRR